MSDDNEPGTNPRYTSSEVHMQPPQDTDNRHVYRARHQYWCNAPVLPNDNIVTADGALGRLGDNLGVCGDCMRAIAEFLGERVKPDSVPCGRRNMLDNLARLSLTRMAESIAVPYRDLTQELVKPLDNIDWTALSRECTRMELAIRDFRDVAHLCEIVYRGEQSPLVTN